MLEKIQKENIGLKNRVVNLKTTVTNLQKERDSYKRENEENIGFKNQVVNLQKELDAYKRENEVMSQNFVLLKKSLYGQSSERVEDIPEQPSLFNEAELEENKAPVKEIEVTYKRKAGKQKRQPFPDFLEREIVKKDLPEDEKKCPVHGEPLKEIEPDVTEVLVTTPAQVHVRRIVRKRYTCSCCKRPPIEAKVKSIIPGSIATEESIAFIIFSKYFQHLPLYRLEEIYRIYSINLRRSVMASWLINIARRLTPIYNILEERMFQTGYIGIDETRVQVLKEKGRRAKTKSSMWVRGSEELGIALFDYDTSKGGPAVKRLLGGYTQTVQADEHNCYNSLEKGVLRLGCMMHARRRFIKARDVIKVESPIANEGIAFFKQLYKLEEAYKDLTYEKRYELRLKEHTPLLETYKNWLLENKGKVPPSSKLGNAINYSLVYWEHLTSYLKDGRYEVDNGFVERQIKQFALGRKNWLFSNSEAGAEASSILYSILVTIKLNDKSPYDTLVKILEKLPDTKTPEDWELLVDLILK